MKTMSKVKWMIWLQFFSMALFLITEVNGRRSCRKLLRNVKLPPHTKLASKQRKNNHVTLVCDKGYYFSKGKNIKDLSCKILKKLTNDRIPKCKGCGQPPDIKNGTVKFPATSVGSVAVYSCDVGFSLKGTRKQRKCRKNLRWSGGRSRISCQKNKCRNPGNVKIRNGNVTFSDRLFEEFSTISFQCNDGYELFGDEDIICLQGKWSIKRRPICRKKRCPRPGIPENGRTFGSRFFIGSSVEFFCNSGFTLFGSRKRTCQDDKTWSGTVAICDDGRTHCRNPGTPIGAIKSGSKHNEGDVVYYSCKRGLKLFQGSQNRTCLKNKTWSGSPPRCVDEDYREFRPINETAQLFNEGFVNSLLQTTCTGTNVSCPKPDARARSLTVKHKGGLDLIIVLDTSSSIQKKNFKMAKEFVKKIVKIFGVDPRKDGDGTHIACVTYGTYAKTQFTFNDASVQTKAKALKKIDAIEYTRGATGTRLALDMVRANVLPSSKRPNTSTKALFLITDGESNVGGDPEEVAKDLKEKDKVDIYVIGVGGKIKHVSLKKLASTPMNKHKFVIDSYEKLDKIMKKIAVKDYSECGVSPFTPHDARARIVGGDVTSRKNWPWAVQIFYKNAKVCGGTLVNKEFILTAAHCIFSIGRIQPSDVQVAFEEKKGKYTVYTSLAVYPHPDYNPLTYANDIALVKIPKLRYFTRYQQAICLPHIVNTAKIVKPGNKMYAVGWGITKRLKPKERFDIGAESSKVLKQVKLPFQTNKMCADIVKNKTNQGLDNWYFNSTTQFCAGDLTGQNDTCHGDSGGPAMMLLKHLVSGKWRWFQVGIVSWGPGCAQQGEVGYYTKVSAFLSNWIDEKITLKKHKFEIERNKKPDKISKKIVVRDYSECGISPFIPHDARVRIVGGDGTSRDNWPWAVQIHFKRKKVCGGTLINKEFILTAAHCFGNGRIQRTDIQVSFHDKKRALRRSLAFKIHPDYNPLTYANDIALVKISKLKYFSRYQQAICLPHRVNTTKIIKPGNKLYAVGWGVTKELKQGEYVDIDAESSKVLKQVKLPFQANKICADIVKNKTNQGFDNWYFDSTTQFCAGDLAGQNDTCKGDSGGPAMVLLKNSVSGKWRWFQVGIVSWGHGCAQRGEVGYYTKVSAFLSNWIDEITKS